MPSSADSDTHDPYHHAWNPHTYLQLQALTYPAEASLRQEPHVSRPLPLVSTLRVGTKGVVSWHAAQTGHRPAPRLRANGERWHEEETRCSRQIHDR